MDLELTSEQSELRDVARSVLDAVAPLTLARGFLNGAPEAHPLHRQLGELGWPAVGLSTDDGFGLPGLCLLAEELGAHVAPAAVIDTAVVARIVKGAADVVAQRWLEPIIEGQVAVALAALESQGDWALADPRLSARPVRATRAWVLNGSKIGVLHGASVDAVAALTLADGRPGCFLVPLDTPGLTVTPIPDLDAAAAPARVDFEDVVVDRDASIIGGAQTLTFALAVARTAVAAEAIGAAGRALDMARDYALVRQQFGRPIGEFQALRHLLADLHVLRETSRSSILYAAAALDEEATDALLVSRVAKAHAARSARAIVEGALQVLGGIGFTWEHDLHLLFRRVLSANARFGDSADHESWLTDRLVEHVQVPT